MRKTLAGKLRSTSETFHIRSVSDGPGVRIEGWATTSRQDRTGEVIDPDAWDLSNYLSNPVLTFAHQTRSMPIGSVTSIEPRANGLYVHANVPGTWDASREVACAIKAGALRTFSVGFAETKPGKVDTQKVYHYRAVELYELAVTPVPANVDCVFTIDTAGKLLGVEVVQQRTAPAHATLRTLQKRLAMILVGIATRELRRNDARHDRELARLRRQVGYLETRIAQRLA